jgi:hypothetical protein
MCENEDIIPISVSLPKEFYQKLEHMAQENGQKLEEFIFYLVSEALSHEFRPKDGEANEALD